MATHSSILAWRIPWTEEPGGLQPMGLQRVRHEWMIKQQQQIAALGEAKTDCTPRNFRGRWLRWHPNSDFWLHSETTNIWWLRPPSFNILFGSPRTWTHKLSAQFEALFNNNVHVVGYKWEKSPWYKANPGLGHFIKWFLNQLHTVYDKPRQHIKKQRHRLPTKAWIVKAMILPVVMYGCESWTIKKAECQKIDAFKLRGWRKLLRVSWTARRSNQSILEEISPECSLEGLMRKLKLQYFSHLMWRADSLEKILMLGKIEDRRRRGRQRMR